MLNDDALFRDERACTPTKAASIRKGGLKLSFQG